jgi:hypothetical protein
MTDTTQATERRQSPAAASNVVVAWHRLLRSLLQAPGARPSTIHPTRDFALLGSAVHAAVHACGPYRLHRPLQPGPRPPGVPEAAATQAAHDVLIALFPGATDVVDRQLDVDLAAIPAGPARIAAIRAGARAAAEILYTRAIDGFDAPPPAYLSTGAAGDYRLTSPGYPSPVFTQWNDVTPFVLLRPSQFRPSPPPALWHSVYAAILNEVASLGRDSSPARTSEQTDIASFWTGPIESYWNAIAEQVAGARRRGTPASARAFALLDLGLADATIALYDAKYTYRLWRPITAIRLADTDGNQLTTGDPAWRPLAATPADPAYPAGHSTLSTAAAIVLSAVFGDDVPFTVESPSRPGVTRSFDNFNAAAAEAGLSRIYAGSQTRIDHLTGIVLGRRIGQYTLANAFR